ELARRHRLQRDVRSPHRWRLDSGGESVEKLHVAVTGQTRQRALSRTPAFGCQRLHDRCDIRVGPLPQALEENVQVAQGTELAGKPAQLGLESLDPFFVEELTGGTQDAADASHGDTEV